jgi:glycosyltransferase involved in cell wall biosynthesis
MRVAFYAPLKPPGSTVPSGDRLIARMLMRSVQCAGHEVVLASRLRSLDREGNPERQARLARVGGQLARRLIRRWEKLPKDMRPDVWLTYHIYHKAPDWIGPAVSASLGIPYAAIEVAYAPRQKRGPWAEGVAQVARCIEAADLVIGLNPADAECVRPLMRPRARYLDHAPYIDGAPFRAAATRRDATRERLARETGLDPSRPWIIAAGMMREGNKLACYRTLVAALARISGLPWQLVVAGDGPARGVVENALGAINDRTRLLGALEGQALADTYAAADLLAWPAIREPIGMVFIEAQAAGIPVVGADRPGPASIVRHGVTGLLCPEGNAAALAGALRALLENAPRRRMMGAAAARHALEQHDITTAGPRLVGAIEVLVR